MRDVALTPGAMPDGLDEIADELPAIMDIIARTARWVHPDTFRAMPVWYPEVYRGAPLYDAGWNRQYTNTKRSTGATSLKFAGNTEAIKTIRAALGATRHAANWTVCHIWGVDDPKFQTVNKIVGDPRYYTCCANMVWLPTPLKGFTDAVPGIKTALRLCAFYLYGWRYQSDTAEGGAETAMTAEAGVPPYYPKSWPTADRDTPPSGVAPFSDAVVRAIEKRKAELRNALANPALTHYPRESVRKTLTFWRVEL